MSITNTVTVGLVSIAFAFSIVSGVSANAQSDDIATLQAQIAQLLEQIQDLQAQANSSTTTVVASGGNAACPYTWTMNLSIGSSGDDVRQLQRFLNGNPQTQVATSGVGSPGNETSYYGPATARAVSRFQEMYAAQILTPLGLTQGTGGFYTSTRNQANSLCTSGSGSRTTYTTRSPASPQSSTSAPVVQVTGDALAVTPGNPISDAYVIEGAQRAPYTSVVLTAGSDDVRVESVRIKRFGLSSSDNFDTVALVDASGVQIGSARSLNSRDEVSLGSNLVIPANRSVTLAIVGNMTSGSDFSAGSIAGLEIAEVIADTRVQGNFPIRGAAHVLSDSITLQKVVVDVGGGGEDIEFNRDTQVASVDIDLNASGADEEDAYLRSVILKQEGSADIDELGDIEVQVDEDRTEYTLTIDRDRFVINFGGRGVMIEENDSVEVSIWINTNEGYEETVQFALEDISDVYVVGASYGYGLPVEVEYDVVKDCDDRDTDNCSENNDGLKDTTRESEILSGEVRDGGRLSKFEDEVRYGDDVILGAHAIEFEGEDVEMEDLTFEVTLDRFPYADEDDNAWIEAEEDTVRLENVHLRIDGQVVAYADDGSIDFDEPSDADTITVANIDFSDNFIIDVRDETEVVFEIVADLDEAWSHFDGASIEFTLTDIDLAEGVRSEKDYTDMDYFENDLVFEEVEVIGNQVSFRISSRGVDGDEFVAGKEDVIFGTFEADASKAIDDIELDNLYISFEIAADSDPADPYVDRDGDDIADKKGDLSYLQNCRIIDESGEEVADSNSRLNGTEAGDKDQMRFRFDDTIVESDENMEFDILCDIDSDARADEQYQIAENTSDSDNDRIEYVIDRDDYEYLFEAGDNSDVITVSEGGELAIDTTTPNDESVVAYAIGRDSDSIETLEITFEAEDEDMNIVDIYLAGVGVGVGTVSEDKLDDVVQEFSINGISADADANDFMSSHTIEAGECEDAESNCDETDDEDITNAIEFERINRVIEEGDEVTVTMDIDYDTINTNRGRTESGQWLEATELYVVYEGEDSGVRKIATDNVENHFVKNIVFPAVPTLSTVDRDEDLRNDTDTTVYEFTITADGDNDIYVKQVGINVTSLTGVTLNNVTVKQGGDETNSTSISATGVQKFEFPDGEAVRISAGDSETFEVEADITGVIDNSSVAFKLATDTTERTTLGQAYSASIGNFVWSPNTLGDRDDEGAENTDWFSGWALFENDDIEGWTWNEND